VPKIPTSCTSKTGKDFAQPSSALDQAEPLSSRSPQTALSPLQQGHPSIFSLPDLLSWELPPVRWTIPDILPEGLTLLAGKPKLGKSWLALSVAISIAAGGVALGAQPVAKGDVLYLALEDNARRLQARARRLLATMTETPSNLEFALDWSRLGEGGLAYLEEYRCLTDLCGKVVIDQGMAAWSHYVLSQRAFLVVVATEQAIMLCKTIGIEVPDMSDEVKRLVEVRPPAPS
jgi:hypothetical protein